MVGVAVGVVVGVAVAVGVGVAVEVAVGVLVVVVVAAGVAVGVRMSETVTMDSFHNNTIVIGVRTGRPLKVIVEPPERSFITWENLPFHVVLSIAAKMEDDHLTCERGGPHALPADHASWPWKRNIERLVHELWEAP